MRSKHFVALTTLILLACSNGPSAIWPTAPLLDGAWERDFTIPGSGETWLLLVRGTTITGTGTWTGEACCAGDLALSGRLNGGSFQIDARYFDGHATADSTPRFTAHFDGVMASPTALRGQFTRDNGPADAAGFHRLSR